MNDSQIKDYYDAIMQAKAEAVTKPCAIPPTPFDYAHVFEHKTFYNDSKDSGYTASVCKKCSYKLLDTYFSKLHIPLNDKID
jgi:hypothetical protein